MLRSGGLTAPAPQGHSKDAFRGGSHPVTGRNRARGWPNTVSGLTKRFDLARGRACRRPLDSHVGHGVTVDDGLPAPNAAARPFAWGGQRRSLLPPPVRSKSVACGLKSRPPPASIQVIHHARQSPSDPKPLGTHRTPEFGTALEGVRKVLTDREWWAVSSSHETTSRSRISTQSEGQVLVAADRRVRFAGSRIGRGRVACDRRSASLTRRAGPDSRWGA